MTRETLVMSCVDGNKDPDTKATCIPTHLELGEGEDGQHGDSLLACAILAERNIKSTNYGEPFDGLQLCVVHFRSVEVLLDVGPVGRIKRRAERMRMQGERESSVVKDCRSSLLVLDPGGATARLSSTDR